MIKTVINDGKGSGDRAFIEDNALLVTNYTSPPLLPQKIVLFREYFTDSSDSNDMLVDGSTINHEFEITASTTSDRYITAVNIEVSDDGSKLKYFGATNVLTNGVQFFYERKDSVVYIHDAMKTNWDMMRVGMLWISPLVDIKPAKDINAKVDAFVSVINFTQMMPPHGIKLDKGTTQRLCIKVRDDLTAGNMPDTFDAIAYGFDRFE